VPLDRIRFLPAPGTACEQDVINLHDRENRLFELVEGVLVEKPMGFLESRIAAFLIRLLDVFTEDMDLGIVVGADGMMRIAAGLVRMPDVSVLLWDRLPGRRIPTEPIPSLAPDLAVEVLSVSNTSAEIDRKISEYFAAGCRCAWVVDPKVRSDIFRRAGVE
jgi:Uma2 family endonuclease